MNTLYLSVPQVKEAARIMRDCSYLDDDELPDAATFERAVAGWLERIVERVLEEPDHYNRYGRFDSDWDAALDKARKVTHGQP